MPQSSFPAQSILAMNATLTVGQYRTSPNGNYKLIFQTDGNLVLYYLDSLSTWSSGSRFAPAGGRTELKANGDLVVYNSAGGVSWESSSRTKGWHAASGPGSYLLVTESNKLVVYAPDDSVLWSIVGKAVPKNYVPD